MNTSRGSQGPHRGAHLLCDPLRNKGTAFTMQERDLLGLHGLLPAHVSTIEEQVRRRYHNFQQQADSLAKHVFLSSLQQRNEILFYRLVLEHISEMLPYIYTPTVGDISLSYSLLYRESRGAYISFPLCHKMEEMIDNLPYDRIDVIVVTDGERILGLGDLGVGGMAIPVGKLALYTLFGGIHPARTLPVLLDVGTNNPELLGDPCYLGWQHERIREEAYDDFIERFVKAIHRRYPNALLQWEDFGKLNARRLLDRYRERICSFNDDIQGTAAVTVAAILSAVKRTNSSLREQRIAVLGGGSAGIGICQALLRAMVQEGMVLEEAKKRFYVVDIDGLIHTRLATAHPHQMEFAQDIAERPSLSLLEVIEYAHPTILIGVSTRRGAFTEEVVKRMAKFVECPIIFPLTNPSSLSEADPADLIRWTQGKAVVATGSPFPPVAHEGKQIPIAQCNNVYIFPGVGLGVIASGATRVSEQMFWRAAKILSEHAPAPHLFPPFEALRGVTKQIALGVAQVACEEGIAQLKDPRQIAQRVEEQSWFPEYPSAL